MHRLLFIPHSLKNYIKHFNLTNIITVVWVSKYDLIAEYYHCISHLVGFLKFALPGVNCCLTSFLASFINNVCLPIIPLLILQRTVNFCQCCQTHQEISQFDFFSWEHLFWNPLPSRSNMGCFLSGSDKHLSSWKLAFTAFLYGIIQFLYPHFLFLGTFLLGYTLFPSREMVQAKYIFDSLNVENTLT